MIAPAVDSLQTGFRTDGVVAEAPQSPPTSISMAVLDNMYGTGTCGNMYMVFV